MALPYLSVDAVGHHWRSKRRRDDREKSPLLDRVAASSSVACTARLSPNPDRSGTVPFVVDTLETRRESFSDELNTRST
jgi:hypothetical protein